MADVKDTLAGITTGPASSIKVGSKNAAVEAKQTHAKEEAALKKIPVKDGEVAYKTMGLNSFSCDGVSFSGTRYITGKEKELEVLDSCVERGLLLVEEDKRKK